MKPTIDYLQTAFDKYNQQCFSGQLPRPRLTLSRARTRLGWMKHQIRRQPDGTEQQQFTIAVTTAYDLPQDLLDDVLIHEMIHLHIACHRMKDTAPHGRLFQQFMHAINQRHQRHIRVAFRPSDLPAPTATADKAACAPRRTRLTRRTGPYIVLAIETVNHHYYLSSVAPSAVLSVAHTAIRQRKFLHVEWLTSQDKSFARYPRVRTLRAVRVSKEEYDRIRAKAKPIPQSNGK